MIQQHKQQGVTLVETMIAMVISLMLMAGVYQTYLGSKQAYRTQDGLSRLQENARFAMDQLSRDIRMANNFGCVPAAFNQFGEQVIVDRSGTFGYDPTTPAVTANNGGIASIADTANADGITIRGIGGTNGIVASPVLSVAGSVVTLMPGATMPAPGNVVISDCRQAEIVVLTAGNIGNPAANQITLPGVIGINGNTYGAGTMVYPVRTIAYSILPGAGGQDGLFRAVDGNAAQEVAEGLESIDFLFRQTAATGTTLDISDAVNYWNDVGTVRVSMVFSTPRDNIAVDNQSYRVVSNDGTSIDNQTAADKRLYRMMSALIDVRK